MHAMEDWIDLSDANKARLVWDATWLGKREPLGDEAAAALGDDLKWAVGLRADTDSLLPRDTHALIQQIENTACKLSRLLASDTDAAFHALHMIRQCWQPPSILSPLGGIKDGLVALCEAAGEAKNHRGGAAELRREFGSEEGAFIRIAAIAYAKFAGKKAGVSLEVDRRTLGGPFVRFVQEASKQFCEWMTVPSSETIKKVLAGKTGVRRARK
jgi:hypothetical protein